MQKIYMSGAGAIPLSDGWAEITKPENFRCPTSVLGVINSIRASGMVSNKFVVERLS